MPKAQLRLYREGVDNIFMRGKIGNTNGANGAASKFWLQRMPNDPDGFMWRGKDCDAKGLYGFPWQAGDDIFGRTVYRECGGTGTPIPWPCTLAMPCELVVAVSTLNAAICGGRLAPLNGTQSVKLVGSVAGGNPRPTMGYQNRAATTGPSGDSTIPIDPSCGGGFLPATAPPTTACVMTIQCLSGQFRLTQLQVLNYPGPAGNVSNASATLTNFSGLAVVMQSPGGGMQCSGSGTAQYTCLGSAAGTGPMAFSITG
jgi:hypothetical protein